MMKPKICLAAEMVIQDAQTNSASAINIIEGISPVGFPLLLTRLSFYVLWERDDAPTGTDDVRAVFSARMAGSEEDLISQEMILNVGSRRHRAVVNLGGLMVPGPGELVFRMSLSDQSAIAEYSIDVTAPSTSAGG